MSHMPLPSRRPKQKKSGYKPTPHVLFSRRVTILTTVFVVVCLIYLSILISLQAKGNAFSVYKDTDGLPDGLTAQAVTIQAMRGEIYDRNGVPLVTNHYSYDLTLQYHTFVSEQSIAAQNKTLLRLTEQLTSPEAGELCAHSFALTGTYPDLSYSDEAMDKSSDVYADLQTLLARLELSPTASADALVAYYVNTYSLGARLDGIPAYTNEQITTLIRLYYDMDVLDFGGAASEYTLAKNVSAAIVASTKESALPGVSVVVRSERIYHYPGYASHILGRVNKIFAEDWDYYNALGYPMDAIVGVSGCESAFENILHGADGQMSITVDETGRTVSSEITKQPVAGQDIRLSIDIKLQIAAEDALRAHLDSHNRPTKGAVVVMDPNTGAYLAIASAPTFGASRFGEEYEDLAADPLLPMFNRALSGVYYPGKLMQLRSAVAGLNERIVTPASLWRDQNSLTAGSYTVLCPKLYTQDVSHGYLGLSTALEDGCDVFFGLLGQKIGSHTMSQYETLLGFGQSTGVEIAEGQGNISSLSQNNDAALLKAAIGESDLMCTPAQLCNMLATIVNGGTRYRGHLLYEIRNFTSGDVVNRTQKEAVAYFKLGEDNKLLLLRTMSQIMQDDPTFADEIAALRMQGIGAGCIGTIAPSGTTAEDHTMLLAYGVPTVQTSANKESSVAISVVLENRVDTAAAADIVSAVLHSYYHLENKSNP